MAEKISFQDWQKIDLRVGKILEVEDVEGADKLYKLIVDVGKEIGKRTICAGIKQRYSKKELKGKNKTITVKKFTDACMKALKKSARGDTILLSPGCSSFDQFKNFEERGKAFKKWLKNLT